MKRYELTRHTGCPGWKQPPHATPNATNGERSKALRTMKGMAELSDEHPCLIVPSAISKPASANQVWTQSRRLPLLLGVTTDYFMDDATFQKELSDDQFYADVRRSAFPR